MSAKNKLKGMLFRLPQCYIDKFYRIYNYTKYPEMRRRKESFGNLNPNEIFYVIRPRTDCVEGLMALLLSVLQHISYAEKQGYVPIVDFKNYNTQYFDSRIKQKNVWEYYFMQPSKYSLDELYKSKNVVLSGLNDRAECYDFLKKSFDESALEQAHIFFERYIKFSDPVIELYQQEEKQIIPQNAIGLYLRGTDYVKLRPAGEAVQPEPKEAFEVVDSLLEKYSMDRVFIVTEDANYYKAAKDYYGAKLYKVSFDSFVTDYKGTDFLSRDSALAQLSPSPYARGVQYLVKLILLSRCRAIVGGNTCGSWAACVMASKEVKKTHI